MSSRYEEPTPVVARLLGADHTNARWFGLGQWGMRCNSRIVRYGVAATPSTARGLGLAGADSHMACAPTPMGGDPQVVDTNVVYSEE